MARAGMARTPTLRPRARCAIIAAAAFWLLWLPAGAWAHAAIVSSKPEPNQRLSAAPGFVLLRFSEPLNSRLSRATVLDPTGRRFAGSASGPAELRVPLSTNAPGIYRVQWTTVGATDGHTLHGILEFGVGLATTGGSEGTVRSSPSGLGLAISLARALEYTSLLLAAGMLLVRRLADSQPGPGWVRPRVRAALALALLSGVVVTLEEALAVPPGPSLRSAWTYLGSGFAGPARLVRLGLELLALIAAISGTTWLWAFVGASIAALAAAGHAAAIRPAWAGITLDALHLLTAGLWAGGILALATLRPPGGWGGPEGRLLLSRFSPVAVSAFLLTAAFGAVQALLELGGIGPLVSTSYGWVLLGKAALVGALVPLSLRAWRRRPLLRTEASVAVLVIGAAALLAAYPLPPGRLLAAETARRTAGFPAAHPRPGDLTLGGRAGQALVGLSLRPGRAGVNEALVYFLPLAGDAAAASTEVTLTVNARQSRMYSCGLECRRASLELRGGEAVAIRVGGPGGGTASFAIPRLPAPDGTGLLHVAQQRMHRLSSYRVAESLITGASAIRTSYAFVAPDRMESQVDGSSQEVWIGQTMYTRRLPGGPWRADGTPYPLVVPFFIWDYFRPVVAPRIVGTQRLLGGVLTTVVSFSIGGPGDPIWFRLWVDSSGLVRRSQMRAPGHFMDQRYSGFDEPVTIEPPPTVPPP